MNERSNACRHDPHWFRCWLREERRTWGLVIALAIAALIVKKFF